MFANIIIASSLCSAACAQSIAITPYPVHTKPLMSEDPRTYEKPVYWSAYINLETQDLHKLWQVARADFLLISATVKIPTRSNVIVRDFPLFTITKGQVQAQSGLDLLKKIPISSQARDQVSITLEVRYIKGQEALEKAKKILNETVKAAEPFLKSYPLASKIIGSAIPIIDQIIEPAAKRFPSSRTLAITPEKLLTRNELIAFIIKPIRLVGKYKGRADIKYDPAGNDSIPIELDKHRLVECSDMKGMLCKGSPLGEYYATLNARRELSDTRLQGMEAERIAIERQIFQKELDCRAVKYATEGQQQQQQARSSGDILDREDCERRLEESRIQLKRVEHDIAEMRKKLASDQALSEARGVLREQQLAVESAQNAAAGAAVDPKAQQASMEADKRLQVAQDALAAAKRNVDLLSGKEFHLYQRDRVKEAIYITFDFQPYNDVFEPLILLRDAQAGCSQLTTTVVQQARDHLNGNEDLFLADDVDVARRSLALAENLIAMQRATETRDVGTVLTLIDEINSGFMTPLEGEGPIEAHYEALQTCAARRMALAPVLQIEQAWKLYNGLKTRGAKPEPLGTCPALAVDSAFRLDLLHVALTNLSTIAGDLYSYPPKTEETNNQQISGPIIRLLDEEAKRLRELQESLPIKSCNQNNIAGLVKQFSVGCEKCMNDLARACAGVTGASPLGSLVEQRRAAVRDSLNLQPHAACGRAAYPVPAPAPAPAPAPPANPTSLPAPP